MNDTLSLPASSVPLAQLLEVYESAKTAFYQKYAQIDDWLEQKNQKIQELKLLSQQALAATTVAGTMFFQPGVDAQVAEQLKALEDTTHNQLLATISVEEHQAIMDKMRALVLQPPGHLDRQDELYLEQQLSDMFGFQVAAELDSNRLNHLTGIMGGEQHLKRYPTDTLEQHDAYQEAGMAPNRGAFGWFTEQGQLTPEVIQREKYYFAVQTLYLPNWNSDHARLKPWYKFRKMVVVNPAENVAVVGVVGDAGPALSVKKQFGGSPEVIREGKIWSSKSRGRVMLFFVDDPENKVPLGPIALDALPTQGLAAVPGVN